VFLGCFSKFSSYLVLDIDCSVLYCIVNQSSSVAYAPPGQPSAAAAEAALGGASRRIVNHNHGLNSGSSQSLHGGGVLVMSDMRNHQRNAGACDSILRENDGLAPSLE
jgi:hypothetical protein